MAKSIVSSAAYTLARTSVKVIRPQSSLLVSLKSFVLWPVCSSTFLCPFETQGMKGQEGGEVYEARPPLETSGFLGETHLCVYPLTQRGIMPVGLTMCGWLNQFNLEKRNAWNSYTVSISNLAVTKVGSTIPDFMSQSTSLLQTIFLTLEISSSHWSWAPVIGCFICLFVVCFDQRDRLWVPLMWGLSVIQNGSIGTGECPRWLIPNSVLLEAHPIKQ